MPWADPPKPPGARGETEAFRVTVRGRVQGVGFRWWTCSAAERCGVRGWVANRADGSVEIFAEGAPGDLERFLKEAEKGPPRARVEAVARRPCAPEGFGGFSVRGW